MRQRNFIYITVADFLVRTAYQMGKTPLLPIFAAALGATDAFLGFIVSVSTLTGMVLKPFIGILSDRWGRRWWLIAGTAFFAGVPFLYRFVTTPEQLFALRILHGTATAIYGPVTIAYVVEQGDQRRAERLGWFGLARSGGYIVGPALAGWLLLFLEPAQVFTVSGLMCLAAFVPVWLLQETVPAAVRPRVALREQVRQALAAGSRTPALWLAGGLEAASYTALYASKAFLPLFALSLGINVALVGAFFAVQEAVNVIGKPYAGRLADRVGYRRAIALGMAVMGCGLPLLGAILGPVSLLALAVWIGLGQALVFAATTPLVASQTEAEHMGAGMGLLGTLENLGKVAGPIAGGLLVQALGYGAMFWVMGGMLWAGAGLVWLWSRHP